LGRIGDPGTVEPLCAALTSDHKEVSRTREGAASALGKLADPQAIAPLYKALTGDSHLDVRKQALKALGEILLRSSGRASPENLKLVAELGSVVVEVASDGEGFFGGWISTDCAQLKQLAREELNRRGLLQ
jgi:hypothetical protein